MLIILIYEGTHLCIELILKHLFSTYVKTFIVSGFMDMFTLYKDYKPFSINTELITNK